MPTEAAQLSPRLPNPFVRSGSYRDVTFSCPNVVGLYGPSSFSCGTKSLFRSLHDLVALLTVVLIGFTWPAISVVIPWRYRPQLNFSAVLPLSKRSYDRPS